MDTIHECDVCGISTEGRKIRSLWNNALCEICGVYEENDNDSSEEEDKREEIELNRRIYFQGLSYGDLGIYCNPSIKINETLFEVKREEFQHPNFKSYYKLKELQLKEPKKYKLKFV
jgi:hypothetical protein